MFIVSVTEHCFDDVPFQDDRQFNSLDDACRYARGLKNQYDKTRQCGDNQLTIVVHCNRTFEQHLVLRAREY